MPIKSGALRLAATILLLLAMVVGAMRIGAARAEPDVGSEAKSDCTKDLMFVFDASGSMGTTDFTAKLPHIARVKNAFRRIVSEIPQSRRMGLIVYGEGAYNQCDSHRCCVRFHENS